MLTKKSGDIKPDEITDKSVYLNRRNFMRAAALATTTVATGVLYRKLNPPPPPPRIGEKLPDVVRPIESEARAAGFLTDEKPTPFEDITTYNNFYEFSTGKTEVAELARNFVTRPWTVTVDGLVDKPKTYDLDDLLKIAPREERIYRFRCVEGWSMVIPWVGFSLSKLLEQVEPTAQAKYVAFETVYDRKQMPNQRRSGVLDWPYVEGLRLDEAMHPLTLLASGLYGEALPPQDGAPLRLVVPWKYGFKSIKSIVKIRLVEKQPPTTWNMTTPGEYGFYSNVNPGVPHSRWSQATEQRIGEYTRRNTLLFNGYAEQVAQLYAGMDLRLNF
jgi:sulfoxide reductase catalytic subunit YedY